MLCLDKIAVDCEWGDFGSWNSCSKTCGGGEKVRIRTKIIEAVGEGNDCNGNTSENKECNTDPCPGNVKSYVQYI